MNYISENDLPDWIAPWLHFIEKVNDIKIIAALVSGSRSYGVAAPNSDYDLKFLFVNRVENYISIDRPAQVIEATAPDGHDGTVTGYELGKYLNLLRKSCTNQLEYLACDTFIKDFTDEWVVDNLIDIGNRCLNPVKLIAGIRGYMKRYIAKLEKAEDHDTKLKCLVHLLRLCFTGVFYGVDKNNHEIAPAHIDKVVPAAIKKCIDWGHHEFVDVLETCKNVLDHLVKDRTNGTFCDAVEGSKFCCNIMESCDKLINTVYDLACENTVLPEPFNTSTKFIYPSAVEMDSLYRRVVMSQLDDPMAIPEEAFATMLNECMNPRPSPQHVVDGLKDMLENTTFNRV